MAIQKTKTLANGAVGNYWRIMQITFDRTTFTAHASLALFKDQSTSDAGAPPLGGLKHFSFAYTNSEINAASSLVGWTYTKIMAAANVMHSYDISGALLGSPEPADLDIYDGTVL